LRKRENYRAALDGFDAAKIAGYGARKLTALMGDRGDRAQSLEARVGGVQRRAVSRSARRVR